MNIRLKYTHFRAQRYNNFRKYATICYKKCNFSFFCKIYMTFCMHKERRPLQVAFAL